MKENSQAGVDGVGGGTKPCYFMDPEGFLLRRAGLLIIDVNKPQHYDSHPINHNNPLNSHTVIAKLGLKTLKTNSCPLVLKTKLIF